MREKIEFDIKSYEDHYTPQWIKDKLVQDDIDKLLGKTLIPEKEKYSLVPNPNWRNENNISQKGRLKHQTNSVKQVRDTLGHVPAKISQEEVKRNAKAKTLTELYVAGILLKMGAEVALMHRGVGYDMLVLTSNNKIERLNVVAERNIDSAYIGVETKRVFKGKTVLDIDSTLADHYIIKICGRPGIYQITTSKLRKILSAHSQRSITQLCEDGQCEVILINRKLLLANCEGLNL